MKKAISIFVPFIVSILLFLPGQGISASPILVGITEDVTGWNADAGRGERDSAILCIEEWNAKGGINGQKIEYAFRDNGGDPAKAATIAKELVNLNVPGVLGGTSSTVALAEVVVFSQAQVPHLHGAMAAKLWESKGPDGKWYTFSFVGSEPVLCAGWVEAALRIPVRNKAVILHLNNFYGKTGRDSIIKVIKENPAARMIQVVDSVEIDLKAADATKEVTRIKAINPDFVFTIFFPDAAMAWFRGCNDLNYHPPIAGYWGNVESVYLSSEPKFLYNFYGYSSFDGKKKEAVEKLEQFKKRFGYTPVNQWIYGYDEANVLLTAIKNVGTNRIAIRDWIATKSKGMPIVSGNRKAVCRFEDGSPYFYSLVYPQDFAVTYVDKNGKQLWLD